MFRRQSDDGVRVDEILRDGFALVRFALVAFNNRSPRLSDERDVFESLLAAEVSDDAEAVAEVVGDVERVAVVADGEAGRVDGRVVVVVALARRRRGEAAHVDERRVNLRVGAGRGGRERHARAGAEAEHPDFVLEAARSVERERAVFGSARREGRADVYALRHGEVDVLDDRGRRFRVQVNDRERLLCAVRCGVELQAVAAVDGDEVAASSVGAGLVGAAHEGDGQSADGGLSRRQIRDERTGGRYRSSFGRGLVRNRDVCGRRDKRGGRRRRDDEERERRADDGSAACRTKTDHV